MVTIQSHNFGVEIEMTGVSRGTAASVIANYFGVGGIHFAGGTYQTYEAKDSKGRVWKCMRDGSITSAAQRWCNRRGRRYLPLRGRDPDSPV